MAPLGFVTIKPNIWQISRHSWHLNLTSWNLPPKAYLNFVYFSTFDQNYFCIQFCNFLQRCNNSCTSQGDKKQSLWEGWQCASNNTMAAKTMILFLLPFNQPPIEREYSPTINSKMIYKIQEWQESPFVNLEFCISYKHHECLVWEWKSSKIWS